MDTLEKELSTEELIKNSAKECFITKGYKETTIRDIAEFAGISTGTIYNYFKGKKELFTILNIPEFQEIRPEYEKKRNKILLKALFLFGEKGYNGVTMDDIANSIGLTKAALYQYFANKEELFINVLQNSSFNTFTKDLEKFEAHNNLNSTISEIGKKYLEIADAPERVALLRTVIRDSSLFPEIGNLYYEGGIKAACDNISNYIVKFYEKKGITIKKSKKLTALIHTYIGTLQSYVLMKKVIYGIPYEIDKNEYLEISTNVFLSYLENQISLND